VITSLNLGLAVLLIFADKIVGGSRLRAVGWSFGVMIVVSAMVIGLNNGLVLSNKVLALTVLHSIGVPALVLGIAFAFRMSRGRRNYILALGWLFFGLIVFSAGLAALSMGVMFYLEGPVHDEQFEVFASAFLFGAILGEILCIIVLPYVFLVLSDRSFRRWLNTFWG
jgi:hypothetical protein